MGIMRFLVHPTVLPERWPEIDHAYFSSFDGRIFSTDVDLEDNVLRCRRHVSDSGRLHIAWPVPGFGRPVISTATLCDRDRPYLLPIELARGKICQIRNQLATWERMGMSVPDEVRDVLREALHLFSRSISMLENVAEASQCANKSLVQAHVAAESLVAAYCRQRIAIRRSRSLQLPASLGCGLGSASPLPAWAIPFCQAFNAAAVPVFWKSIEQTEGEYEWDLFDAQANWCDENRLFVWGGPLLDFSEFGLPTWLDQWKEDAVNLQSFLCDFVETAVSRYVGRIRTWEIASRVNTGGALDLSEEDRIALIARVTRVARQVDEEVQLYIGVDQPWGSYLAHGKHRFSPIDFVDALMRFGIGLTGVNLEINIGYRTHGTASRDMLDFSRLIDQWSTLDIPLYLTLAFPSACSPDANARPDIALENNGWKSDWSESAQAKWIDLHLPLLLSKQSVVGIFWTHFSDSTPHELPHAGLVRDDDTVKPALERIIQHHATWK